MRPSIIAVFLLVGSSTAVAGSHGGDPPPGRGDGSGRLGRVSGGIGDAVGNDQKDNGSSRPTPQDVYYGDPDYAGMYRAERDGRDIVLIDTEDHLVRRITPPKQETNRLPARFDLFLGVQKVVESDTAFSASLAISDDWFRLAATVQRYWEDRMDGAGKLTMTMPTLTLGIPVQQGGGSHAYIEGGVAHVSTGNDPEADSSITGGKLGVHVEQGLRTTTIIGDVHGLLFEAGVKAVEARLAVRWGKLEGAFRVIDFNVGPALYGPELGLAF